MKLSYALLAIAAATETTVASVETTAAATTAAAAAETTAAAAAETTAAAAETTAATAAETTAENTKNEKKGSTGKAIIGTVKRLKSIEIKKENAGLENRVSKIMNQHNLLLASKIAYLR